MSVILVAATILLASVSRAAPTGLKANSDISLGVYLTEDPDWGNRETTGAFTLYQVKPGECQDLQGTPYDKQVSSIGPNEGVKCTIYEDHACQGKNEPVDSLNVWFPGYARLGNFGWDNKMSSFNCTLVVWT